MVTRVGPGQSKEGHSLILPKGSTSNASCFRFHLSSELLGPFPHLLFHFHVHLWPYTAQLRKGGDVPCLAFHGAPRSEIPPSGRCSAPPTLPACPKSNSNLKSLSPKTVTLARSLHCYWPLNSIRHGLPFVLSLSSQLLPLLGFLPETSNTKAQS